MATREDLLHFDLLSLAPGKTLMTARSGGFQAHYWSNEFAPISRQHTATVQ
jgi:hypothetical protein